jgi:hypothetical protein
MTTTIDTPVTTEVPDQDPVPDRTTTNADPAPAVAGPSHKADPLRDLPTTGLRFAHDRNGIYEVTSRPTKNGPELEKFQLATFDAHIIGDLERDDGVEITRQYEIRTNVGGKVETFAVAASDFAQVSEWVSNKLGAGAIITAVARADAKIAQAIQTQSTPIRRTVYTHTGWREIRDEWFYLTSAGALGVEGLLPGIDVELDAPLDRYEITGEGNVADGVRATLDILDAAPDRVTVPMLGMVFRSVLGPANFVFSLVGTTGARKSTLLALAQQHWGAGLDHNNLPASWSDTPTALQALISEAKDALVVVDDYAPDGGGDARRLTAKAEDVIRSIGNHSAKGRGKVDGSRRTPRPPRGSVASTGEDHPKGASIVGRMLNIELKKGDVDLGRITPIQAAANRGVLADGMGGYLMWLAADFTTHQEASRQRATELRGEFERVGHARTPSIVAELLAAWELWLEWAEQLGHISSAQGEEILERVTSGLNAAAGEQTTLNEDTDVCTRFMENLAAVIASGSAHVTDATGAAPDAAGRWGWRQDPVETTVLRQLGRQIGWITDDGLYLDPIPALREVQALARSGDNAIAFSAQTIGKRLAEGGYLASTDTVRKVVKVRKTLAGVRRQVWHLPTDALGEQVIDAQVEQACLGSYDVQVPLATLAEVQASADSEPF